MATDDNGSADLVDTQYLLFNVVAMGYFLIAIFKSAVLPEIPAVLLAMTSGTAALYVGNKAAHRNAPEITSISPRTVAPGRPVTIMGSNFDPADQNDTQRRISLNISGYERTLYANISSDTRVLFEVPPDAPAGHRH